MRLIVLSIVVVLCTSHPMHKQILDELADKHPKEQFKAWHYLNKKEYSLDSPEAVHRYTIFKSNLEFIKKRNSEQSSFKLGFGPFTDLTFEEFQNQYLSKQMVPETKKLFMSFQSEAKHKLPIIRQEAKTFDEMVDSEENPKRNLQTNCNDVTTIDWSFLWMWVRNQGKCAAPWAFVSTSTIEAFVKLNDELIWKELSVQQLIDCDTSNAGCQGGWYDGAYDYARTTGLLVEDEYPYSGIQGSCKAVNDNVCQVGPKPYVKLVDYHWCMTGYGSDQPCSIPEIRDNFLMWGPYAGAIYIGPEAQHYTSGILEYSCTGKDINHGVVVTEMGLDYIKIRNSWGKNWGEEGYAYFRLNEEGTCGLTQFAWQPTGVEYA